MNKTALAVQPSAPLPWLVVSAGERAGVRFLEFFASAIRNPRTRGLVQTRVTHEVSNGGARDNGAPFFTATPP